jgi:error-prone DNA polymerase
MQSAAPTADTSLALRLGFRVLKGLPVAAAEAIVQARQQQGLFRSLADFARRTCVGRALTVRLSEADVFASLQRDRRSAMWEALSQARTAEHLPLLATLPPDDEPPVDLPTLSPQEEVFADYRTAGLSLKAHPLSFHRHLLDQMNVVPAAKLRALQNRRRVCVAGLVLLRQRPSTAKGITFVTLEDETGTTNLLVHQATWERYYQVARRSSAWLAHGRIETKDSVIHVIVERLDDLSSVLGHIRVASRDFR